jgi:hypothetical protein
MKKTIKQFIYQKSVKKHIWKYYGDSIQDIYLNLSWFVIIFVLIVSLTSNNIEPGFYLFLACPLVLIPTYYYKRINFIKSIQMQTYHIQELIKKHKSSKKPLKLKPKVLKHSEFELLYLHKKYQDYNLSTNKENINLPRHFINSYSKFISSENVDFNTDDLLAESWRFSKLSESIEIVGYLNTTYGVHSENMEKKSAQLFSGEPCRKDLILVAKIISNDDDKSDKILLITQPEQGLFDTI